MPGWGTTGDVLFVVRRRLPPPPRLQHVEVGGRRAAAGRRRRPAPRRDQLPDARGAGGRAAAPAEVDWPLRQVSDHGTHEAIYISDPDGNDLELVLGPPVRRVAADAEGQADMAGAFDAELDLEDLLKEPELAEGPAAGSWLRSGPARAGRRRRTTPDGRRSAPHYGAQRRTSTPAPTLGDPWAGILAAERPESGPRPPEESARHARSLRILDAAVRTRASVRRLRARTGAQTGEKGRGGSPPTTNDVSSGAPRPHWAPRGKEHYAPPAPHRHETPGRGPGARVQGRRCMSLWYRRDMWPVGEGDTTGDVCTTGAIPPRRSTIRSPFDGEHCAGFQGMAERRWRTRSAAPRASTTRPPSLPKRPRSVRPPARSSPSGAVPR